MYHLIKALLTLLALLPLRVLYLLSDLIYLLGYHLVGYRKKVVRMNLRNAYPEKTIDELRKLERQFYHRLSDYVAETIKLFHMPQKEIERRMRFEGIEVLQELIAKDRSVMIYLGHCFNWEWITSMYRYRPEHYMGGEVYRPLKSKLADQLFLHIRNRHGNTNIAKNDTLRWIMNCKRADKPFIIGMMADQTPSIANTHYWTTFLSQETAMLTGVERIAQRTDCALIYLDVQRLRRGEYVGRIQLMTDAPRQMQSNEITEQYARLMEATINRDPAGWLWTHKRWKHKRTEIEKQMNKPKAAPHTPPHNNAKQHPPQP